MLPSEPHLRNWMTTLCGDETWVSISKPFAADKDGVSYDCATNGHAMVLVQGATFEKRTEAPDVWSVIPNNGIADRSARTTLGALLEWAKPNEDPRDDECDTCDGNGYTECGECGQGKECDDCDGSGEHERDERYPLYPGKLVGVILNRRLLHFYLAPIPSDPGAPIVVSTPDGERVRVQGDGWFVIVMMMRYADKELDEFPPKEKVA